MAVGNKYQLHILSRSQYDSLPKSSDYLYFVSESDGSISLYKGDVLVSNSFFIVSSLPSSGTLGKLYLNTGDGLVYYHSGSAWVKLAREVITSGLSGASTNDTVPSSKLVWDTISSFISTAQDAQASAEAARDAAISAKADAETAMGNAESARDAAVSAKTDAEAARGDAQTASAEAESARDAAVSAKTAAEAARSDAQTASAEAKSARDAAVSAKTAAEAARSDAQTASAEAEAARGAAVSAKVDAEIARGDAESARSDAWAAKVEAEWARDDAVAAKVGAQEAQASAEAARDAAISAKEEAGGLLDGKADVATTLSGYGIQDAYTKTETDGLLDAKANVATTYTKTETDVLLDAKADKATTIAGYGITDAYTKTEVDAKVTSVYRYRGTVSTYADLPSSGQKVGDVYNVETADSAHGIKAGDNVAWTGSEWDALAGEIDLTPFALKADAATDHNHDSHYLKRTGGQVIGSISVTEYVFATDYISTNGQLFGKTVVATDGIQQVISVIPDTTTACALSEGVYSHIPNSAPTYTLPSVADTGRTHEIVLNVRFGGAALSYSFDDSSGNAIAPLSTPTVEDGTVISFLCRHEPLLEQWAIMPVSLGRREVTA